MSICICYHDEPNFLHERGVCYGTKEKEPCSCGGDETKCDFYEEVRSRAKKPETNYDRLISKSPEEMAKWLEQNTHYQNGDMPWEYWRKQEADDE